jgi:hypothetical protein
MPNIPPAGVTLEGVGITPGSRFLATPEEQAAAEAEEAARIDAGVEEIRRALDRRCHACGASIGLGGGPLCGPCRQVNWLIDAQAAGAERVDGRSRHQLVEAWLDGRTARS